MEINICQLDRAIMDTLKAQGLEGARYVVVVWGQPSDKLGTVASNVYQVETVERMLSGALAIITTDPDIDIIGEIKGNA